MFYSIHSLYFPNRLSYVGLMDGGGVIASLLQSVITLEILAEYTQIQKE